MSKLHDLITQLCPDGVPYKKLNEVLNYEQPSKYLVSSKDYSDEYSTPVLTAGKTFILGYTNEVNGIYQASKDNPVIIFDDFTTDFKWVDFPFKAKSSGMKMLTPIDSNTCCFRYIYYAMSVIGFVPSDHKRHWISQYSNFTIPLPPLPVQSEIVRILDSFTELEAELEAELAGRIEQYEYYRDYLLDKKNLEAMDGKPVETKKLGEVGSFIRGNGIQKKDFVDNGYPCIHYGQVYTYYGLSASKTKSFIDKSLYDKRKKANPGDLVIATTSENDEDVCKCVAWLGDVPAAVSGDAYIYSPIDELKAKYLAYFFQSRSFQSQKKRYITGTKVRRVNGESMAKIELPVPSLATQKRVVDILDRFDALTTSLTDGIPAEIAMRREQYEYYRSRLLDFPRLPDDSDSDGE